MLQAHILVQGQNHYTEDTSFWCYSHTTSIWPKPLTGYDYVHKVAEESLSG